MEQYKRDFIDFMVRCKVLTFGDFTAKSGRKTPYFVNAGNYDTGVQIRELGRFYARALETNLGRDFDNLYGPAYKGIPLCVTASIALSEKGHDVSFTFNRKEVKDHGEGGSLVGYKYQGGERIVIIEDVTTAGTSVRESVPLLNAAAPSGVELKALVVSVDRQEQGLKTNKAALEELAEEFGIQTFPIVNLDEIVEHLRENPVDGKRILDDELLERIAAYREQYGA